MSEGNGTSVHIHDGGVQAQVGLKLPVEIYSGQGTAAQVAVYNPLTEPLPQDLVAILADSGVERRGPRVTTVYSTVACSGTGELWFSFGACPGASRGDWQPVPWPW